MTFNHCIPGSSLGGGTDAFSRILSHGVAYLGSYQGLRVSTRRPAATFPIAPLRIVWQRFASCVLRLALRAVGAFGRRVIGPGRSQGFRAFGEHVREAGHRLGFLTGD